MGRFNGTWHRVWRQASLPALCRSRCATAPDLRWPPFARPSPAFRRDNPSRRPRRRGSARRPKTARADRRTFSGHRPDRVSRERTREHIREKHPRCTSLPQQRSQLSDRVCAVMRRPLGQQVGRQPSWFRKMARSAKWKPSFRPRHGTATHSVGRPMEPGRLVSRFCPASGRACGGKRRRYGAALLPRGRHRPWHPTTACSAKSRPSFRLPGGEAADLVERSEERPGQAGLKTVVLSPTANTSRQASAARKARSRTTPGS